MGRHFWFYRQLLVLLYWRTSAGSDDPVAPITTVEDKVFIGPSRTGWRRMATRFTSDVHLRDWRSLDEGFEHGAEPLARWIASPVLAVGFRRRGAHKRERERERKKKETETGRRRWPPSSAPDELLSFWLNAEIASQYPAPPPDRTHPPLHLLCRFICVLWRAAKRVEAGGGEGMVDSHWIVFWWSSQRYAKCAADPPRTISFGTLRRELETWNDTTFHRCKEIEIDFFSILQTRFNSNYRLSTQIKTSSPGHTELKMVSDCGFWWFSTKNIVFQCITH